VSAAFNTSYGCAEVRLSIVREDDLAAVVPMEQPILNRAELAADFWRERVASRESFDCEKECFVVVSLDRRNRVKGWNLVSVGTQTGALAHPGEIFRAAIVAGAAAVLCMHNHPSGDPSPSAADVQLTRQVREAGKVVDISVLDHVVVGRVGADPLGLGHYSFREAGLL
jgi:DNA repair protein RadC